MLTTIFVALLYLAVFAKAGGHPQRRAAQNGNDTALLRKRSNLTDIVFDRRMLGRLFGKRPPSPPTLPTSHLVLPPITRLYRLDTFWTVEVRTPTQHLNVTLDTDSSCFWMYLPQPSPQTLVQPALNHDSHHCRFRLLDRKDVIVPGDLHRDKIGVGGVEKNMMVLYSTNRVKWIRSELTGKLTYITQGVLGLSFAQEDPLKSAENPPKEMAFVPNVLCKTFPHPVFALYLAGPSGELHMGMYHPGYYQGSIEFHGLTKPSTPHGQQRWQIGSAVIDINGHEDLIPRFETVFDTMASPIYAPMEAVKKIYQVLRGPKYANRQFTKEKENIYPCNEPVMLYLRWKGMKEWTINQDIFNMGAMVEPEFRGMCRGLIMGGPDDFWRIGTKFMETLYLVFDATQSHPQLGLGLFPDVPSYGTPPPNYHEQPPALHGPPAYEFQVPGPPAGRP